MLLGGLEALEAGDAAPEPFIAAPSVYRCSSHQLLEISIISDLARARVLREGNKGMGYNALDIILALKLNPSKQIVSRFPEKILNPIYFRFLFKLKIL